MPSKKKVAQQVSGIAQLCPTSKMPNSGDALLSHSLNEQERLCAQPPLAETCLQQSLVHRRSASQKSISTDEGSSSSGLSSEESTSSPVLQPQSDSSSPTPAPQEFVGQSQTALDLSVQICTPDAPLWVGNGLSGDEAAWLLVLPKFPEQHGDHAQHDKSHMPKTPNDAVLLGPYVMTKNTFLDESRVGGSMGHTQRSRAKSVGALR